MAVCFHIHSIRSFFSQKFCRIHWENLLRRMCVFSLTVSLFPEECWVLPFGVFDNAGRIATRLWSGLLFSEKLHCVPVLSLKLVLSLSFSLSLPPAPPEAPLRKAKFVESPRIPESELGSPTLSTAPRLDLDTFCPGKHACRGPVHSKGAATSSVAQDHLTASQSPQQCLCKCWAEIVGVKSF